MKRKAECASISPFPYTQRQMSPPQRIDTGWPESCRVSTNLEIASFTGPKGLSSAMKMISSAGSTPRTRSAGIPPSICAIEWATAFARRNCFTLLKRHRSSSHWGSGWYMSSYHECRSTLMRRHSKREGVGKHDAQSWTRCESRNYEWGNTKSISRILGLTPDNISESLTEMLSIM